MCCPEPAPAKAGVIGDEVEHPVVGRDGIALDAQGDALRAREVVTRRHAGGQVLLVDRAAGDIGC